MPIYEYRCGTCGFQKEFLQRLNEKPLTKCPECGKRTFRKMVTAAGFQLKGTGWYATDFKHSGGAGSGKPKKSEGGESASKSESGGDSKSKSGGDSKSKESPKSDSGGGASATAT